MAEEDLDGQVQPLSGLGHLPSLAARPPLPHDRALNVHPDLREVEVGRERLLDRSVRMPLEHVRVRLVLPDDPVRVEDERELQLDRVRESGFGGGAHGARYALIRPLANEKRPMASILGALMAMFTLEPIETADDLVVHVEVSGELDLTNVQDFEERLAQLEPGPAVALVLDLNRVVFIDSAALHALFRISRRLGRDRFGIVLAPAAPIARTLEI